MADGWFFVVGDFSLTASAGLRDYFSRQEAPLAVTGLAAIADEIFIDGFGWQQALLASPSPIIESRELRTCAPMLLTLPKTWWPHGLEAVAR